MGKKEKKKKDARPDDYWTNPYYREQAERERKEKYGVDPNRPMLFTYLCIPIGAALGLLAGFFMDNLFIGTAFGAVMGILVGTKLDAKFPRKK